MKLNLLIFLTILFIGLPVVSQTKLVLETEENDQRVLELGLLIDETIVNNDPEDYMSYWAIPLFSKSIQRKIKEISSDITISENYFNSLKVGLINLPKKIIADIENGSYYDFISYRYDAKDKAYYMLFRLFSSETGVNYHDYRVCEVENELKFKDLYVYTTGEMLSETYGRMFINTIPKRKLSKLFSKSNHKEFAKFLEVISLSREGKYQEAYDKMESVKGSVSTEKYFLLIKGQTASQIDDELYLKALREMIETYPDDTTLYLNYIDYYILLNDPETALEMIDKLQDQTEDDFLNFMKGNLEFDRGDLAKAGEHFKYMTENYTDFFDGYASYLTILCLEKQFETAVNLLEFMVEDGYEKQGVIEYLEELDETGTNILEDLVNSTEYINWKE